jgi:hypothetical protein
LSRAAKETDGISIVPAKAHAEVALAETALQVGDRAQAQAALEAVGAMRKSSEAKAVSDPDLVRAVAVAATLGERQRAISMIDMLSTDDAKLDALARLFAAAKNQGEQR